MAEPTFRTLEILVQMFVVATGTRITYLGEENVPKTGGAGIASSLIKRTGTIPVDRGAGADAYAVAVQRLREGELVGVYPEATISRSFELKAFKTGAARMAAEAGVPIVPLIVWGAQRIWTKDHPRHLGRAKVPITVQVGAPLGRGGGPPTPAEAARIEAAEAAARASHETR